MSFNPLNATASFIANLQAGQVFELVQTEDGSNIALLRGVDSEGEALEDDTGSAAIQYNVSVGQGRGSAKIELNGAQVPGALEALEAFDPESSEDTTGLTPAQCIDRTIMRHDDGSTSFKVSLAKNSRTVKVPAGEWDAFLDYMSTVEDTIPVAVTHYRAHADAAEAAAKEAAAKEAATAAK